MPFKKKIALVLLTLGGAASHSLILSTTIVRIQNGEIHGQAESKDVALFASLMLGISPTNKQRVKLCQSNEKFSNFINTLANAKAFADADYITIEHLPFRWLFGWDRMKEAGMRLNTIIALKGEKKNKSKVIKELEKQYPTETFTPEHWEDTLSLAEAQTILNKEIKSITETVFTTITSNPLADLNTPPASIEAVAKFIIGRNFLLDKNEYTNLTSFLQGKAIPHNVLTLKNDEFITDKTTRKKPPTFCLTQRSLNGNKSTIGINRELYDFLIAAQNGSPYLNAIFNESLDSMTADETKIQKIFTSGSEQEKAELFIFKKKDEKKQWSPQTQQAHDQALYDFNKQIWQTHSRLPDDENTAMEFYHREFTNTAGYNYKKDHYITQAFKDKPYPKPGLGFQKTPQDRTFPQHPFFSQPDPVKKSENTSIAPDQKNLILTGSLIATVGVIYLSQRLKSANKKPKQLPKRMPLTPPKVTTSYVPTSRPL